MQPMLAIASTDAIMAQRNNGCGLPIYGQCFPRFVGWSSSFWCLPRCRHRHAISTSAASPCAQRIKLETLGRRLQSFHIYNHGRCLNCFNPTRTQVRDLRQRVKQLTDEIDANKRRASSAARAPGFGNTHSSGYGYNAGAGAWFACFCGRF